MYNHFSFTQNEEVINQLYSVIIGGLVNDPVWLEKSLIIFYAIIYNFVEKFSGFSHLLNFPLENQTNCRYFSFDSFIWSLITILLETKNSRTH